MLGVRTSVARHSTLGVTELWARPRQLAADHQDLPSDGYEVDAMAGGPVWDAVPAALPGQPVSGVLLASLGCRQVPASVAVAPESCPASLTNGAYAAPGQRTAA